MSLHQIVFMGEPGNHMLTRSKAAIFRLLSGGPLVVSGWYLAKSRLSLMIRQIILSGAFFDAGVKKLDMAFSKDRNLSACSLRTGATHLLTGGSGLDFTSFWARG